MRSCWTWIKFQTTIEYKDDFFLKLSFIIFSLKNLIIYLIAL